MWALVLPGVWAAWCVLVAVMQGTLVFPRALAGPGASRRPDDVVQLVREAPGGAVVEAWLLERGERSPLLVFFHGNAELIDGCVELARRWRARGFAVLLVEYRGYGRCGGAPSERGIVEDALELVERACAREGVDGSRVLLHGRSLGGGVACQVARVRHERGEGVSAMVLESTFTSVASFSWKFGVPGWLCRHPFRNDRVLSSLDVPVLLLHGVEDEIVPIEHGRRLSRLARDARLVELRGRHNEFPADERAYWEAIDAFLAERGLP